MNDTPCPSPLSPPSCKISPPTHPAASPSPRSPSPPPPLAPPASSAPRIRLFRSRHSLDRSPLLPQSIPLPSPQSDHYPPHRRSDLPHRHRPHRHDRFPGPARSLEQNPSRPPLSPPAPLAPSL